MSVSAGYVLAVTIPDNGNPAILAVGKQHDGTVDIINAFSGDEALELFWKIVGKDESNRIMSQRGQG